MSPRYIIPMIAVLALCLSPVVLADDSDAETVDYGELYCYGDNPIIMQLFPETKSTWSVTSDGIEVPFDDNGDGSITIRLAGVDGKVTVTQTYNGDTAIQVLIPLHLPSSGDEDGIYTVTFHDGNSVIWTHEITNKTTVSAGDLHVITPSGPSKEGYVFNGWYTSPGFESESKFDPKVPVEGDMDVYANWTVGSSEDSTIVTVPDHVTTTHIVTFDTVVGLEYDIIGSSSNTVSFTVSVVGGYELKDGTLRVTSNGGVLTGSDGTYTLSNIDKNIIVSITGEVSSILDPGGIDEPEEPKEPADDGGFPLWILVVVVVIIIAIVAIVWYMRGRI